MNLVKYHNDFNNINLKGFNEKELNLLMSICFKLRDKNIKKVCLSFDELKLLANYEDRKLNRFIKILNNIYDKLLKLNFSYKKTENIYGKFVLFTEYEINEDDKTVIIQVNEKFKYMLNELTANYTKFELEQFTNFKSNYSKLIFRLLKQFESTKIRIFKIEEFRELLVVPEKYRISEINRIILSEENKKELEKVFINLKIEPIKKNRKIEGFKFIWGTYEDEQTKEMLKLKIGDYLIKNKKYNILAEFGALEKREELEKFIEKYNLELS